MAVLVDPPTGSHFSPLERRMLDLWLAGRDTHAIAEALKISESRVASVVYRERTERLSAQRWRPLAAIRPRRWP